MDSNIIELVKLGHERADELKSACGAVNVRSVAQLISDLASQLEVQYVRAEESQREFRSADITMQNLEAQLKQSKIDADCYKKGMEASNARLVEIAAELSAIEAIHNDAVFITDDHYEQCPSQVQKMIRSLAVLQIPAYKAFLAEVRASALDEFAIAQDEQAKKYFERSPGCSGQNECQFAAGQAWYFAECIRNGAAQLRKGGAE